MKILANDGLWTVPHSDRLGQTTSYTSMTQSIWIFSQFFSQMVSIKRKRGCMCTHTHYLPPLVISKLGKKLHLRQRVIATATVFFRRFYLKNSYCETDPFIVIAACCYVAAKAEESPAHIKNVVTEARSLFSSTRLIIQTTVSDLLHQARIMESNTSLRTILN
jgi:hypothetical protein